MRVQIVREYRQVPAIMVDRHKVLQILVNLIRNARNMPATRGTRPKEDHVAGGPQRRRLREN